MLQSIFKLQYFVYPTHVVFVWRAGGSSCVAIVERAAAVIAVQKGIMSRRDHVSLGRRSPQFSSAGMHAFRGQLNLALTVCVACSKSHASFWGCIASLVFLLFLFSLGHHLSVRPCKYVQMLFLIEKAAGSASQRIPRFTSKGNSWKLFCRVWKLCSMLRAPKLTNDIKWIEDSYELHAP